MRVIVCGSRRNVELRQVYRRLDDIHASTPITTIVHGASQGGADNLAESWARATGVPVERYPAAWRKLGSRAGPVRNAEMAASGADLCVAFWNGESPGTLDMVRQALKRDVPVQLWPTIALGPR